jgi:cbb3-type cytochrome c oxidase subunit I
MLVGLLAAIQLAWPEWNWGPYLHFGRVRPLHTNAVIFGFTLGVVFAGSYYGVQRLCRVRMFSDTLSRINLWGWNAIIVAAAVSLLAGKTTSKEYAELEWPIDLAIAVVWVVYAINFLGTVARRREKPMYAALWFWIATILTIAMLHIVNNPRCRSPGRSPTRYWAASSTPTCSGGTDTTRWASCSPRRSSASCTTSCRSRWSSRSTRTGSRSCTSGR